MNSQGYFSAHFTPCASSKSVSFVDGNDRAKFPPPKTPQHSQELGERPQINLLDISVEAELKQFERQEDRKSADELLLTPSPFRQQRATLPVLERAPENDRVLTVGMILVINYFLTCGGPSGIEVIAAAGGPLLGIFAVVVYPIVFSVPFASIIAELSTAFPDDGGFVLWVHNAFGPFWGFQQGYWAWVSTLLGNALYPIAIISAVTSVCGDFASPVVMYFVKVVITILLALPTLFGARIVSRTCLALLLFVLVPFVIFSLWSFIEAKHYEYLGQTLHENGTYVDQQTQEEMTIQDVKVDWSSLFSNLFWCYDGIYLVSLFGGQVKNPTHTYPRAIFITLLSTVVSYLVPLTAVIVVGLQHWSLFDDNTFVTVAGMLGGLGMKTLMMVSSISSNAGLFSSAAFCGCYQLNGMAQCGLLPQAFARRHYAFDTPYISLLANTLPVLLLLAFDFDILLGACNAMSAFVQLMIILAAIKLRMTHGDIYRPAKLPGGMAMFVALMTFPVVMLVFMVYNALTALLSGIILGVFLVVGVVYGLIRFHDS